MSDALAVVPNTIPCDGCGNPVPPRLTVCPSCHSLIHRTRLESLSAAAEAAESAEAWAQAVRYWRDALPLLPPGSKQYEAITARIANATSHVDKTPSQGGGARWGKLAPVAAAGAAVWKFKFLLAGLMKLGTLLSMLAFVAVYWAEFGWPLAVALVVTTYIHEMGHVAALTRLGIHATAPMFLPGFGAYVRLKEHPATVAEDARVGLAGPVWGVTTAVLSLALGIALHARFLFAVAHMTAVINLFNLTPVWQLDGGRGFNAMSRVQRVLLAAIAAAGGVVANQKMFGLVAIFGLFRIFQRDAPQEHDWTNFAWFAGLLATITAVLYAVAR